MSSDEEEVSSPPPEPSSPAPNIEEEHSSPVAAHAPAAPAKDREESPEADFLEAKKRMEQDQVRRKEKADNEWKDYEEFRAIERKEEEEEIAKLRERRALRHKEREEEEKRMAGQRQVEEQKRRAEEEERQRKKREEENRRREEREKKRAEFEERKNAAKPNFVITKKEGGGELLQPSEEDKKEEVTKSKEQIEAEKRAIVEQRVPSLSLGGMNLDQLKAKAKELHDLLFRSEGETYDLGERFKRQSYDMQELAERARQMNKGGKARAVVNEPDPRAAKFSGIPTKIPMYSQYERVKDRRTFVDRRDLYLGENYAEEYVRIEPEKRLVMTEDGFQVAGTVAPSPPAAEPAAAAE